MEQKVIPIILNGKDSAERMKEITDRLETGIQQLFDSDRYKAYLTTMAKFHNYSFNNTLLIAMQGGQLVAGFNKWKDTFFPRSAACRPCPEPACPARPAFPSSA